MRLAVGTDCRQDRYRGSVEELPLRCVEFHAVTLALRDTVFIWSADNQPRKPEIVTPLSP
jgi:hypothetical protein